MEVLENQVKNNRKKFRVDHFDMVISEYIQRKKAGDLILNPPYQRLFRWDDESQSALIESILIGIPIPPIFVFQNDDAKWEIIDGLQRTGTLINFLEENSVQKFKGCEILTELNGKTFKELDPKIQRYVKNTRIRIELIEETNDIFSQYLLFNRLNSNGEKLESQEIRNFLIYKLNEEFYSKIQKFSKEDYFRKTLNLKKERISKQENVEYVVKFFLGRELSNAKKLISYKSIDDLITKEIEKYLNKYDNIFLNNEYEIFKKTFHSIYYIFGNNSFRYYHKRINSIANTFSMAIGISYISNKINLKENKELILKLSKKYFNSNEYKKITDRGFSPTKRIYELSKYSRIFFEGELR